MTAFFAIVSLLFSTLSRSPMVSEGSFANGIKYYIAVNPAEKGHADFLVVQRNCPESPRTSREMLDRLENTRPTGFFYPKAVGYCENGFISYPSDSVRVFEFHSVPVSLKSDLDSTLLVLRDIMARHAYSQAVVICGDVDKNKVVSTLETLSLTLKPSEEGGLLPELPQPGPVAADTNEIVIPLRLKRPSRDNMNTVIPYVGEFMVQQVRFIFEERMYRLMRDRGIPYLSSFGNNAIRVKVPREYRDPARQCLDSLCNSICTFGFGFDEMMYSRKCAIPVVASTGIESGISNAELSRKCRDAFLYNTDLPSGQGIAAFLEKKNEFGSVDLSRLNLFAALALRGRIDTAYFSPAQEFVNGNVLLAVNGTEKKLRVKNESSEVVTGGKMFTLSNGMKVIFKHTDDRLFSYCLDLRGGAGLVEGITDDEYPYVGTVLKTSRLGGIPGHDFFSVLKSEGIEMEIDSGWSDLSIRGSAAPGKLPMVLSALWKVSYSREPDKDAFEYAVGCANMDREFPEIAEDFTLRVEKYLERRFSNWSDGVLVIAGPFQESEFKSEILRFLPSVKTSREYAAKARFAAGTDNYPLTVESYLAFRIADIAIHRRLASALLPYGMYVGTRPAVTVSPSENISMEIRCVPCPEEGLPVGVVAADSLDVARLVRHTMMTLRDEDLGKEEMDAYRRLVSARMASEMKKPEVMMEFVRYRYADNRDICSDYASRLSGVTAADVRKAVGALMAGDNLKWIWK